MLQPESYPTLLRLRSHCALGPSFCSTPPQTGLTTLISIFPAPLLSLATLLYRLIILGWPCRPPWSMFWLKFTQDYQLSVATGSRNEEFEIQSQAFSQLAGITVVCRPPDSRQGLCSHSFAWSKTPGAKTPGTNPHSYLTLVIGISS